MTTSTCNNLQPDHSSSGADSTTATATVAVTAAAAATAAPAAVVLVIGNPEAPEFSLLQQLPAGAVLLGLGQTLADFAHLSPEQWASCDVLLKMGGGSSPSKQQQGHSHLHRCNSSSVSLTQSLEEFLPLLSGLKWIHSGAVGLEHLLTPALVDSAVLLTNARGVYSQSLAEFALMSCHFYSKQLPRLMASQAARLWDVHEVEELRGKTMGLIGFGAIGRRVAELARAYQMRVVALQRDCSRAQPDLASRLLAQVYSVDQLHELMAASDYVCLSLPHTSATEGLVSAAAIAAMKPTGVIINVGRGRTIDEEALIQALKEGRIKGAALDVFATEPLPSDSPLSGLPNVLLTPHCSAHTSRFMFDNVQLFLDNLARYVAGEELLNVVDKSQGY